MPLGTGGSNPRGSYDGHYAAQPDQSASGVVRVHLVQGVGLRAADFNGKSAYVAQRELEEQAAYLCTFVLEDTTDAEGVVRYPVGQWPLLDPETHDVIIDSHGRRSYTTSVAFGPSLGQNIAMGYLPSERAKEGEAVLMEYFGSFFSARIVAVGYRALLDPENERVKS